jgi:hypothetical protein
MRFKAIVVTGSTLAQYIINHPATVAAKVFIIKNNRQGTTILPTMITGVG